MLNKVMLIGRLGGDPELKTTKSGSSVCAVSIATSEQWKDKQTGQKQERTEWHRVVFYDRSAEVAAEYLRKGSMIYVEGRIQTREYEANGVKKTVVEIIASEMKMLGGNDNRNSDNQSPQPVIAKNATYYGKESSPLRAAIPPKNDESYDDIPF